LLSHSSLHAASVIAKLCGKPFSSASSRTIDPLQKPTSSWYVGTELSVDHWVPVHAVVSQSPDTAFHTKPVVPQSAAATGHSADESPPADMQQHSRLPLSVPPEASQAAPVADCQKHLPPGICTGVLPELEEGKLVQSKALPTAALTRAKVASELMAFIREFWHVASSREQAAAHDSPSIAARQPVPMPSSSGAAQSWR
jgi:hypothetical protein